MATVRNSQQCLNSISPIRVHHLRLTQFVVFVYTHFLWNSRYHFRRKTNLCSCRFTRACGRVVAICSRLFPGEQEQLGGNQPFWFPTGRCQISIGETTSKYRRSRPSKKPCRFGTAPGRTGRTAYREGTTGTVLSITK